MDEIFEDEVDSQPRDAAVDEAIGAVAQLFANNSSLVAYTIQIQTLLERQFFHWITGKALMELAQGGKLQKVTADVQGNQVNFYAHPRNRYWRRQQRAMQVLLERVFHPSFTHAVGRQGELLFDAAFARNGFRIAAQNANAWSGRQWQKTNENLDRIVELDGRAYGVEIKNTQTYIARPELYSKLDMCRHLNLTPLFIMRAAPKSYMRDIIKSDGYGMQFEFQAYPFGQEDLVREVQDVLKLKVHSPKDVQQGHFDRLLQWHAKTHKP